jgi:lipase chaperone LimK
VRAVRLSVVASIALGLVVAVGVARSHAEGDAPAAPAGAAGTGALAAPVRGPGGQAKAEPAGPAPEAPAPMPGSLSGTEVDGALDVGPGGHLVVGPQVITLFDYFFSASGEESDAVIAGRIAAFARGHLGEPAVGEALALLDHYLAYREAARGLRADATATTADRLAAVGKLRREHFGEAAGALFGDEERAAAVAVEKSRIVQDPGLSPEEREDQLAAAEEKLPAAARRAREEATSVSQLRADEQALRTAGADSAEIRQFRAGTLGPEAADRLEALDRDRAAWKARVEAFRVERDGRCAGVADPGACESGLLAGAFDAREQIRVRAILGVRGAEPQ